MQPEIQLTSHEILSINARDDVPSPILQLLSFENLTDSEDVSSQYRIVLFDGTHMQLSILSPKYSDLLLSNTLKIGSMLSMASFACRNVWNTRVIIIFNLAIKFTNLALFGKPRYLFKEQEQQMLGRDTSPTSKCSLKFGIHMPSVQHETSDNISPLKALNPFQNKWSIKGRVTNKRKMHHYSSPKSSRRVFSFDMIDVEGTEIRITCFGDIAEMHYHRVEARANYCLSKGTIREAKTKWNKLNNHLEITLDHNSILKRCDAAVNGEVNASRFTSINEIMYCSNNTLVDVIGLGEDLKNMHATQIVVVLAVNNAHVGYFNGKIMLQDHTDSLWATAFDEIGKNLLNISAKDLYMLQYDLTTARTPQSIIKDVVLLSFIFTLSITIDMYNSHTRIKATITKATTIDFQVECALLLADIARMSAVVEIQTN
ncbi:replication protein A 70 kDa DNA-binding subunit C-like [Cryptomeria japonica]|uniref:replication protein A 70 kDa DNA-binding subunit C-like n=1 Tax=Cryptomeria japonica TaxID=3369 RepID=UPI0027DA0E65|nr:replication protein A 70 kDa DNA-binding subunit C-like [Cryptomeria japonica]